MKWDSKKYHRDTTRIPGWDYGCNAIYFITICTKDMVPYFGEIEQNKNRTQNGVMQNIGSRNVAYLQPTEIGKIARKFWSEIPKHFPFVDLGEYILMPNHIHGILHLNKEWKDQWETNKFGPQSQNLASVIRGYKAGVKSYATKNNIEFWWQALFYEHRIRSKNELQNTKDYIQKNPENWKQ